MHAIAFGKVLYIYADVSPGNTKKITAEYIGLARKYT